MENNSLKANAFGKGMMEYGQSVNSFMQYAADNNLTQEEIQRGVNDIEVGRQPTAGDELKIKPYVKAEVALGAGYGFYVDGTLDHSQLSLNTGETLAIGGRASSQVGLQFGPYLPNLLEMGKNNSLDFGFGVVGVGLIYGKDGIGLSVGVGPAVGWSGISKGTPVGRVDINGSSGSEFYHYDFLNKGGK